MCSTHRVANRTQQLVGKKFTDTQGANCRENQTTISSKTISFPYSSHAYCGSTHFLVDIDKYLGEKKMLMGGNNQRFYTKLMSWKCKQNNSEIHLPMAFNWKHENTGWKLITIQTYTSSVWPTAGVHTYSYENTGSSWLYSRSRSKSGIGAKCRYSGLKKNKRGVKW